jgi:hypothetical protein
MGRKIAMASGELNSVGMCKRTVDGGESPYVYVPLICRGQRLECDGILSG